MYDLILTLKQSRDHGACFITQMRIPLRTMDAGANGGRDFHRPDKRFWQQLGAEDVATMKLDPIGTAVGTIGLSMTAGITHGWGWRCHRGRVGNGSVFSGIGDLADDLRRDLVRKVDDKRIFLSTRSGTL